MGDVVELENVEDVCRLCLAADEPKSSIFGVQESAVPLVTKIQACLSIQISSSDKLSTLICGNCIKSVNQWHEYREACLRSQDKLHQWLASQTGPMVVTIKDEPVDLEFYDDNVEVLSESNDSNAHRTDRASSVTNPLALDEDYVKELDNENAQDTGKDKESDAAQCNAVKDLKKDAVEVINLDKQPCAMSIKTEPQDDYDTDCTIEIESITGSELVPNPLSIRDDRVMEADSTQKSSASASSAKKKLRRGPHTHFRGARVYKQKCRHCQINLHSKYSYTKHMERFHSEDLVDNYEMSEPQDDEEMIEDLEDELISMEKDSPLTQVQQSIISQLKTFSCYSCQQTFTDRRSTLSHIRQHMPDLRPYTCIACLTEFPDRSMYKLHCGASFECAMKIALVVPKHGHEKYFTCNMCLRPLPNRKELLSHLSKHSDKQYEELMSPRSPPKLKPMAPLPPPKNEPSPKAPSQYPVIPHPYKNGDPAHNHICDLCGMIYRYKPNMLKHRELCVRLSPDVRTSYKCVHCGMTFLVFKKFHNHITLDHKKKDFTCAQCNVKFRSPSDYLTHHENHRKNRDGVSEITKSPRGIQSPLKQWNNFEREMNTNLSRISPQKYSCALCGQEFPSRAELSEHRNLHLKVKIYSCVICRSMFSSAGALEIHMKDHGIEDPNERNANSSCMEYGQLNEDLQDMKLVNASTASDPGTVNNACDLCNKVFSNYANLRRHVKNIHKAGRSRYSCHLCTRTFKSKEVHDRHLQVEHKSAKAMLQCPQCPKSFVFQANLNLHCRSAHGPESRANQECDICGKVFREEASLKIHKGWHNRANSRLNSRFLLANNERFSDKQLTVKSETRTVAHSLPNSLPPTTSSERPARARKSFPNPPPVKPQADFQCQVCDDRFTDVTALRKHLWDVHCARNKPEKSFSGDELQCELCTNVFPDQETLKLHMQWHKAHPILSDIRKQSFPCEICGKHYSSKKVLYKHKKLHKANTVAAIKFQSLGKKPTMNNYSRRDSMEEPKMKRVKIEIEDNPAPMKLPFAVNAAAGKKPVMCHLCKKFYPNMSVLYKHKQLAHKSRVGKVPLKIPTNECVPLPSADGKVSCNVCFKQFPGVSNLRQHFTLKHKNKPKFTCPVEGCDQSFPTPVTLKNHEVSHTSTIYSCNLCDRHVFNRFALTEHMLSVHNTVYEIDSNKSFHRETDLRTYEVKGAFNATCPRCKIKYPNNRAMKIHYFKFHETAD